MLMYRTGVGHELITSTSHVDMGLPCQNLGTWLVGRPPVYLYPIGYFDHPYSTRLSWILLQLTLRPDFGLIFDHLFSSTTPQGLRSHCQSGPCHLLQVNKVLKCKLSLCSAFSFSALMIIVQTIGKHELKGKWYMRMFINYHTLC